MAFGALLRQKLRCSFTVFQYGSFRYSLLPCIASKCVWLAAKCLTLTNGIILLMMNQMSLVEAAIGWLAPPDCLACGIEGSALCADCSVSVIKPFGQRCWRCNKLSDHSKTCPTCRQIGPLSHVWTSTNYEDEAQQLVQRYKFGHLRHAALPLAGIMSQTFADFAPAGYASKQFLVVPVPTATSRVRQRGFGHSELLAKTIAMGLRFEYSTSLRRLGQTRQLGSSRDARLHQLEHSFALKNPKRVSGRDILLIDDVLTTGGTLISAAKALKSAGAEQVNALVFAKRL
jgi:ComF family protein